jgi:hypothetical protein
MYFSFNAGPTEMPTKPLPQSLRRAQDHHNRVHNELKALRKKAKEAMLIKVTAHKIYSSISEREAANSVRANISHFHIV